MVLYSPFADTHFINRTCVIRHPIPSISMSHGNGSQSPARFIRKEWQECDECDKYRVDRASFVGGDLSCSSVYDPGWFPLVIHTQCCLMSTDFWNSLLFHTLHIIQQLGDKATWCVLPIQSVDVWVSRDGKL